MSSEEGLNSSDSENACVVCFKNVEVYSVGVCDHPVCFECSTRMRVLCKQNECPICRQDMPQVIFTKEVLPFIELQVKTQRSNLYDRKSGIYFCSPSIQRDYYKLLEHNCGICSRKDRKWPFKTFQQLKDHMRREHELFYCDLCVDNLKIFTFERKCYNRQELGQHRRKGDVDNTSHRGHPLCEFCDTRYVDSDELFRHLRRDHLFCHFCDADGRHEFYNTYADLRNHFLERHYLCEEGDCKNEMLTAVFRTDIDLKAHMASVHSRNLGKAATRQARTLELEFTLAPRPRGDNTRNIRHQRNNDRDEENGAVGYDGYFTEPGGPGGGRDIHTAPNKTFNSDDFPSLGNSGSQQRPMTSVTFSKVRPESLRVEDFPSLGSSSQSSKPFRNNDQTTSRSTENNRAPEFTITRTLRGQKALVRNSENFPALGEPSASAGPPKSTLRLSVNSSTQDPNLSNLSIQVKHKPNGAISTSIRASSDAFPALGEIKKAQEPQWVQMKPKKAEQKQEKVNPSPALPPSGLSDFPTLSKGNKNEKKQSKKTLSVTVPVADSWVNLNSLKGVPKRDNRPNTSKSLPVTKMDEESEHKSKSKKKKPKSSNDEKPQSASTTDSVVNGKSNSDKKPSASLLNGVVKKRSELKIDTLETKEPESVVRDEDFPSLGSSIPPPGFRVKPPPGFDGMRNLVNANSGPGNDLTFTNSTGRSYSIRPITKFHQPDNFAQRNRNLIERFMSVVNNNEAIREFKNYSELFRIGTLPANKYYEHCKHVLGEEFDTLFSELLVLLPDIEKQQELYRVHQNEGGSKHLEVCSACKQVIMRNERGKHEMYHNLNGNFPELDSSKSWRK